MDNINKKNLINIDDHTDEIINMEQNKNMKSLMRKSTVMSKSFKDTNSISNFSANKGVDYISPEKE